MEKNNLYEIQGISKKRTDATDDTGFVKGQRFVGTLFFGRICQPHLQIWIS